jgi:uncharacterized protein YndB with AHSA1/START domain
MTIFTEKKIIKEQLVNASREQVWKAFTTSEGVKSFFAPDAKIDLRLGGPYECYFLLDGEPGHRGSEECTVLSFLENEMLSFTWNAPPQFPEIRIQRTFVVIQFFDADENQTRVKLTHSGWRTGGRWEDVFGYFEEAWDVVLSRLKKRFERGAD